MKRKLLFAVAFLISGTIFAQKTDLSKMVNSDKASYAKSIDCPAGDDVVFSQASTAADLASVSNSDAGYAIAQHASVETIASVRFFGLNAFHNGTSFVVCDTDPMTFDIKFYADVAGVIGAELTDFSTTATLTRTATGDMFASSYPIYYWDWTPSAAVTGLPADYYISFTNADATCWFMWYAGTDNLSDDLAYGFADGAWTRSKQSDEVTNAGMSMCITTILVEDDAPAAVSALTMTPADIGALTFDVSWTNPSLTFAGAALTEITALTVTVNGVVQTGLTIDLGIGAVNTLTGLVAADHGVTQVSVFATNASGDGPASSASAYVGEDIPAAVTDISLEVVGADYVITWTAPTAGANDGYLGDITGYVINRTGGVEFTEVTVTEATYTDVAPAVAAYTYSIVATTAAGAGTEATYNFLAPSPLPFAEDFEGLTALPDFWEGNMSVSATHGNESNGLYKNVWSSAPEGNATLPNVGPCAAATVLTFDYRWVNYTAYATNPTPFIPSATDKLEVFVSTGGEFELVQTIDTNNHVVTLDFASVVVDLAAYDGQNVVVKFIQTRTSGDYYIDLDNVSIFDASVLVDLAVIKIEIPEVVALNTVIPVTATIKNNTIFEVTDALSVNFETSDGVTEQVSSTVAIPALGTASFDFSWTPAVAGIYTVDVDVDIANDENPTNDMLTSSEVEVKDAIIIGAGTNPQYLPLNFYYQNSVIETIYTAEEMGDNSNITTLSYDFVPATTPNLPADMPVKIWVGETANADLSAGPINAGMLALVYDGIFPTSETAGKIMFTLDNPYVYAGGNFVVLMQHPMTDDYYSGNKFLCDTDTSKVRTYAAFNDSDEYDPYDLPAVTAKGSSLADKAVKKGGKGIVFYNYLPNIIMDYNNDPTFDITFTVTDGTSALENAIVQVAGKMMMTDASGNATAIALDGTYAYTVNLEGYEEVTGSVTVDGADITESVVLPLIPKFTVTGTVFSNAGDVAVEGATVIVGEAETTTAADGTFTVTEFVAGTYPVSISAADHTTYTGSAVVVDADVDLGTITLVEIIMNPTGLLVEVDSVNREALFSWGNVTDPTSFSDDFEGYDDFVIAFDPWTLHDVDGKATYGFSGITFPNSGAAMAGIIFNPTQTDPVMTTSLAYSGDKYLAVFNPADASPCNDWVIAPKVAVAAGDVVSFMARGGHADYSAEIFQIFVSTTGTEIADFTALTATVTCPSGSDAWAAYSYDVSAYAGQAIHVALHITSVDQFYFCLDDFYVGTPATKSKAVLSYNVFLNDMTTAVATGVTDMEYNFTELANADYTAGVQSVYASGVSEISTIDFTVDITSINSNPFANVSIHPNPTNNSFFIDGDFTNNTIANIYDVTGKIIMTTQISGNKVAIDLSDTENGLYFVEIVSADNKATFKVYKQ
ncbi:MAG: choice-of-anchor J domain-containing protein [Salinivirgaceae bacterium]|nr:choice-of-anchor J domain-containing protein [Salinivirgaceae bacterium]